MKPLSNDFYNSIDRRVMEICRELLDSNKYSKIIDKEYKVLDKLYDQLGDKNQELLSLYLGLLDDLKAKEEYEIYLKGYLDGIAFYETFTETN